MKIYLAGKIYNNCWRNTIVDDLRCGPLGFYGYDDIHQVYWPVMESSILSKFHYTGPYFVGCDHGCFHVPSSHGWGEQGYCGSHTNEDVKNIVFQLCKKAIDSSDILFAWIDSSDAFGTISEIAYAHALGKKVAIGFASDFSDMWFLSRMGVSKTCSGTTAREAFIDLMQEIGVIEKDNSGYIYLMHAKGTNYYKIGRSIHPTKREYQLNNTKGPYDVELIKHIKTRHDVNAEKLLHGHFSKKRKRGEWFELDPFDLHLFISLNESSLNSCLDSPSFLSNFESKLKSA